MLFWRNRHQVDEAALNAFVDGELDAVEAARVTMHVDTCAACRETVAELRALSGAMKALAVERAPRSFVLREADVTAAPAYAPAQRSGLLAGATPLLSGVAMVAFLAFFVLVGIDVTGGGSSNDADSMSLPAEEAGRTALESGAANDGALDGDALVPADSADNEAPPRAFDGEATGDTEAVNGDDAEATFALPAAGEYVGANDDLELDGNSGGLDGTIPDEAKTNASPQLRDDDDDSSRLRLAQTASAAVALVAGGSVFAIWWRRRSAERD